MMWSSVFLSLLRPFPYFVLAQTPSSTNNSSSSDNSASRASAPTTVIFPLTGSISKTGTSTIFSVASTGISTSTPSLFITGTPHPSEVSRLVTAFTIVTISVAAVAVLCVIAFFVWKFTRKSSDFDDTPHPFPVETIGSAFDTTIAPFSSGRRRARPPMTRDGGAVFHPSDSGSRPGGTLPGLDSRTDRRQRRMSVPQRAADLRERPSVAPRLRTEGKPRRTGGSQQRPTVAPRLRPERRPQQAGGSHERPTTPRLRLERRQSQGQVQNLKREVEQLRVEMDAIRAEHHGQPRMTEEPPPGYIEQVRADHDLTESS